MNCREYQHQITLLLYEELPEKTQAGLQAHLEACSACQNVYESEKNMHSVLAEDVSGWDFPSDLLVESRRSLADDVAEQHRLGAAVAGGPPARHRRGHVARSREAHAHMRSLVT